MTVKNRAMQTSGEGDTIGTSRNCPLCGAPEARTLLTTAARTPEAKPYHIVECGNCALRYTHPLPSAEELTELYGHEYYGVEKSRRFSWDRLRRALHHSVIWQRRRALLDRPPGRALDIGCGDGDFLAALKRRGWEVYGTEFSAAAYMLAQSKGIAVHQGELASASYPDNFFDVVTLWHVLEHLPVPAAELAEIQRILRDDGLLVVEVPNSACTTFQLCGERWFPLGVPGHLQHFTPATVQRLLRHAGFIPRRRQNFHYLDFVLSFISFMDRLGVLGPRQGTHYFVTDYRQASRSSRARFLALGAFVGLLSLPYSIGTTIVTGNGETVTITSRKAAR